MTIHFDFLAGAFFAAGLDCALAAAGFAPAPSLSGFAGLGLAGALFPRPLGRLLRFRLRGLSCLRLGSFGRLRLGRPGMVVAAARTVDMALLALEVGLD